MIIIYMALLIWGLIKISEVISLMDRTKSPPIKLVYHPEKKSAGFVPKTFEEYIGQEKAKSILKSYISGIQKLDKILPHTLIYGGAGTGKTTLARILCGYMNVKYKELISSTLENVEEFINLANEVEGGVVILDEVHSLDRNFVEKLYTIMTDFNYNGTPITPFTIIGCTTEYGEMVEKCLPFVERFKIDVELEKYTEEDIIKIVKQFKENEFADVEIEEGVYKIISENSKQTPRRGIKYLTSTIYLNNDVNLMLDNFNIIEKGYTKTDIKILSYLKNAGVAGIQSICSYLGTSSKNYQILESYLLQNGLITRTSRGRKITEEGLTLLEKLKDDI